MLLCSVNYLCGDGYCNRGSHGKSWNLKPSWDVMKKSWIFFFFSRRHGKLLCQGKSHVILPKSDPCMIYGCGSLLVYIYKFTTFFLALSLMYYNVCVVVDVRRSHLNFSKVLICG